MFKKLLFLKFIYLFIEKNFLIHFIYSSFLYKSLPKNLKINFIQMIFLLFKFIYKKNIKNFFSVDEKEIFRKNSLPPSTVPSTPTMINVNCMWHMHFLIHWHVLNYWYFFVNWNLKKFVKTHEKSDTV